MINIRDISASFAIFSAGELLIYFKSLFCFIKSVIYSLLKTAFFIRLFAWIIIAWAELCKRKFMCLRICNMLMKDERIWCSRNRFLICYWLVNNILGTLTFFTPLTTWKWRAFLNFTQSFLHLRQFLCNPQRMIR